MNITLATSIIVNAHRTECGNKISHSCIKYSFFAPNVTKTISLGIWAITEVGLCRDGVVEADSPNWLHAVDPSTHPKHETILIAKLFPTSSRQFSTDKEQNAPHYEIDPQTTSFCFSSSAKAMDFRAHNLFTSSYNTSCNMHIALPSKIKPLTVIHIIREFNFRRLNLTFASTSLCKHII